MRMFAPPDALRMVLSCVCARARCAKKLLFRFTRANINQIRLCARCCKNVSAAEAHKATCGATAGMHRHVRGMMTLEQVLGTTVASMAGAAFVPDSGDKDCDASVGNAPSGALPLRCSH